MSLYILIITSCVTSILFMPLVEGLLNRGNVIKENFKGDLIPVGMGIILVPVMLINVIFMILLAPWARDGLLIFLVGSFVMAFSGIIDDVVGDHTSRGLKGHLTALRMGRLTSGGLKAITGGLIALFIGLFYPSSIIEVIINIVVITLTTNLLNLFDLRPGRCLKVFLLISIILIPIGATVVSRGILFILIGFSIIYLRDDLKGKSMLGDVGANILGINLGIALALSFSLMIKLALAAGLVILHLVSEKTSFSKIIQGNQILNYLDEIGRVKR